LSFKLWILYANLNSFINLLVIAFLKAPILFYLIRSEILSWMYWSKKFMLYIRYPMILIIKYPKERDNSCITMLKIMKKHLMPLYSWIYYSAILFICPPLSYNYLIRSYYNNELILACWIIISSSIWNLGGCSYLLRI
jgi:hypothetical protein